MSMRCSWCARRVIQGGVWRAHPLQKYQMFFCIKEHWRAYARWVLSNKAELARKPKNPRGNQ
jgi:hypothetical protein